MDDGYAGAGAAAALLLSGGGGSFLPGADAHDEAVRTTMAAAPGTRYYIGGGGYARNGPTPSPSEVTSVAEAVLAASYCSIPSGDIERGVREEEQSHHHDPHQTHVPSVYAYPPLPASSSKWGSDGARDGRGGAADVGWDPRPRKESRGAFHQGLKDDREEEWVGSVGRDGGGGAGGAGGHEAGVPAKRQARMLAIEKELMDLAQGSKRMRSTTSTAAPSSLIVRHHGGMGFPPSRRDLTQLLQGDGARGAEAMKSISTNPGTTLVRGAPAQGGTEEEPLAAIRRRHRGGTIHEEEKPIFPAKHADVREEPFGRSQELSSRRRGRVTTVGPTIPKINKRKVADRCQHPGCSRGSTFGPKGGARRPTNCATHKREGMVKITSRQCAGDMCSTAPSYGFQGKRASFCSKHKMPGMINVVTPRCQRDGCASCASYGHAEERRPLFCARHAPDGMINVVSRKCLHAGCIKNPSYGHPGDRRASFCVDHHQTGMSNVVSPKCLAAGCGKAPSFGKNGDRKATWCKAHKQQGMVNILYKRQLKRCAI